MPGRATRLCLPGALGPGTWARREGTAAGMGWHQRVTIWVSPSCHGDPRALSRVSNPMALGQSFPSQWFGSIQQPWDDQKVVVNPKLVVNQQPGAVGTNCPSFPLSSTATSKGKNSSCQVKWKNDQYPAACQVQAH